MCGSDRLQAERTGDALVDRAPRRRRVERDLAVEQAAAEPSEDEVGVRVGRRPAPAAVRRRAGSAPALCGPLRSDPPASIQAMLPPPAPMVITSTLGNIMG